MGPRTNLSLRRRALALAISAVLYGAQAQATAIWVGPANGLWSENGNWKDVSSLVSGPDTALRFEAATGAYPAHNDLSQFQLNALDLVISNGLGPRLTGDPIQFRTRTKNQGGNPTLKVRAADSGSGHASLGIDSTIFNTLSVDVGSSLTLDWSGAMHGSTASSTASVVKLGAGTLVLAPSVMSTLIRPLEVRNGALSVATDKSLPMEGVTLNGGTLRAAQDLALGELLSLGAAGGGIDTAGYTVEVTDTGSATTTAALSIVGSGTLVLDAASSPLAVEIDDAFLRAGGDLSLGPLSIGAGGGGVDTAGYTVEVTDTGSATTTAALSIVGSGTLVLDAASSPLAVEIDDAFLRAGGDLSLGPLSIGAGGGGVDTAGYTVEVTGTGSATTTAALSISGSGTLLLGAGQSSVAGLAIQGAQFRLAGSALTTTGNVEVSDGGTVGGTGQLVLQDASAFLVNGAAGLGIRGETDRFSITASSTAAKSGAGSPLSALALMPSDDLTLRTGATLNVDLGDPLKDLLDQFFVTGTISIDRAIFAPILEYAATPGETLFLVVNDGTDPIKGTFDGLPDGALLDLAFAGKDYRYQLFYQGDFDTQSLTGGNDLVMMFRGVPEPGTLDLLWLALPLVVVLGRRSRQK